MSDGNMTLPDVLDSSPVRVIFAHAALGRLGESAAELGARRALLVSDGGLVRAGHVDRAVNVMRRAGIHVEVFTEVAENPTTDHVDAGLRVARAHRPDLIVGLGGGSAMDGAKGINLLYTNGGRMADYRGENPLTLPSPPTAERGAAKPSLQPKPNLPLQPNLPAKPNLPMILIPTTAGTGSEAQSFALISDASTHEKMACGDRRAPPEGGLRPRVAILDPELTRTLPRAVAAAAGIDALAHAVETAGCTRRNAISMAFSREAWRRLDAAFERALADPDDDSARADMLLGAHLAGCAIEFSMLGAAHACANPLTARFGIAHGVAVGLMLPHVIRFNATGGDNPYAALGLAAEDLAGRIDHALRSTGLPRSLHNFGVPPETSGELAQAAALQWTARFNPVPVGEAELCRLYETAM